MEKDDISCFTTARGCKKSCIQVSRLMRKQCVPVHSISWGRNAYFVCLDVVSTPLELIEPHEEKAHYCVRSTCTICLCKSTSVLTIHFSRMMADMTLAGLPVTLTRGIVWSRLTSRPSVMGAVRRPLCCSHDVEIKATTEIPTSGHQLARWTKIRMTRMSEASC
jgi:hypothetical protein